LLGSSSKLSENRHPEGLGLFCFHKNGRRVDGKGLPAAQQLPFPLATALSLSTTSPFCHPDEDENISVQ
jgi:hypothetical protein